MKSDQTPPRAAQILATTAEMMQLDQRLRGVFSFSTEIPALNDYLASIQIDDDHPGFLFDWHPTNVTAFVNAANALNPAENLRPPPPPPWLRTPPPPQITTESFIDDVMNYLQPVAGGHVAWVLLAPNTVPQFGAIYARLAVLQAHDFMQAAAATAEAASAEVHRGAQYLATTYGLTTPNAHQAQPNHLEALSPNEQPLRPLFF